MKKTLEGQGKTVKNASQRQLAEMASSLASGHDLAFGDDEDEDKAEYEFSMAKQRVLVSLFQPKAFRVIVLKSTKHIVNSLVNWYSKVAAFSNIVILI